MIIKQTQSKLKNKLRSKLKTKINTRGAGVKSKLTNKLRLNVNTDDDNKISILSYNISWESMSGNKKDWVLCSNNTNPNHPKHSSVCVSNIANVINNNKTDFITLQEATDYKKLLNECPNLKMMNYAIWHSSLDVMITFWNKKYKLINQFKGEFERGRPWLALLFSNNICLINVHFGHYNKKEEYYKLNNLIEKLKNQLQHHKLQHKIRFIISGDFNFDIKDLENQNGVITLNNTRFYYNPKHLLTCCILRRRHYDHILDSFKTPINIIIPDVEYMASDHKPIIGFLHQK